MPTLRRHAPHTAAARQRGSIVVTGGIWLSVAVILLAAVDIGNLFWQRRELQKIADLSALAGAGAIALGCATARTEALANAAKQVDPASTQLPAGYTPTVTCGNWNPQDPRGASNASANPPSFFRTSEEPTIRDNAVRVQVSRNVPILFAFNADNRTVTAQGTASAASPMAQFSVGTRLVAVGGSSILGGLLKGIGLNLTGLSLAGYDGLAQARVTPAGILQALGVPVDSNIGVGELNALLAARQVTLGALLDATVSAAGQTGLLSTNAALVNAIRTQLGVSDLQVRLGSLPGGALGLFANIQAPDSSTLSVLTTGVNALDIVQAAVGVATQKHAVAVPGLSVASGTVQARVALIEPPSVALGTVGATAYTAQVRTYVKVDTGNLPLLGRTARVQLPIMIDTITGKGTLADMCTPALRAGSVDRARIAIDAPVLKTCIGTPGSNPANEDAIFSTSASCEQNLSNAPLLSLSLLGMNLASLNTKAVINALPLQDSVTLAPGETGTLSNNLQLSATAKSVTDALLAAVLGQSLSQIPAGTTASDMAVQLWGATPCTSLACRQARMQSIKSQIDAASSGLQGFVGNLSSSALSIVGNLLALNVANVLNGVGNLVNGLLNAVGDLVGSVVGGCTALIGSNDAACIAKIESTLSGSSAGGGQTVPNAVTALVGFLLGLLQPVLDSVGTGVLRPLLENVLGMQLGTVDVKLNTLNCRAAAMLVY